MCCKQGERIIEAPSMQWWDRPSHERDTLLKLFDLPKMKQRCRAYNNLFTFTAMKHKIKHPTGDGISMLKLGGRTVHYAKSITDLNSLQWYVHDPVERLAAAQNQKLDQSIVKSVAAVMESVNVHCATLLNEKDEMWSRGEPLDNLHVELLHNPRCMEVASLSHPERAAAAGEPRNVIITQKNTGVPHRVDVLSSLHEPLQYPLFFPSGSPGWGLGAETEGGGITQLMYYKHMLLRDVIQLRADPDSVNQK